MAGVLPYLATSASTFYCAFEMHHAAEHGSGYLLSGQTAELALHIIEPLQVGYGAVVSLLCTPNYVTKHAFYIAIPFVTLE